MQKRNQSNDKKYYNFKYCDNKKYLLCSIICNTMRRILEHYFNVIGNLNYEEIIDNFSGQDKLICKTLLSYINAGSHRIDDDFHLSISNEMVDKYKDVFKKIFESAGQLDHYNMMMRP